MRPAKLTASTMRPTMAGFAKLWPRPPNICFAMTTATKLPRMAIHRGIVEGRLNASRMPVTTADRSLMVIGFFMR